MKRLTLITLLALAPTLAVAQPFAATQAPQLEPTIFGSLTLGDFDADGDLDVVVTGSEQGASIPTARIYRNDGRVPDGTLAMTDVSAVFPDVAKYLSGPRASSADIGDFDNDGDLDLLLSGSGGTIVYRNEGAYRFTGIRIREESLSDKDSYFVDIITAPSAAWGDFDSDGDLDVLLTSRSGSFVYRNDGYARFSQVDVGLPALPNGIVSWGDYDNDGDLDILAVSRPFREEAPRTRIYRNDGGSFVDTNAALPGIEAGTIKWGDYDQDGDLDILVMSRLFHASADYGAARRPGIFRNDRGIFSPSGDTLPAAWYGDWIDYDNDGDLDILVNGLEGNGTYAQLIRNDGGHFRYKTPLFSGVWFGDATSGDIDGDGRLDILMNGRYQVGSTRQNRFILYRNVSTEERAVPPVPLWLASRRDGDRLILSWRLPWSQFAESESVTYNLRVGTTPGGSDVLSPMSLSSGKRLVPQKGNAGHNRTIVLNGVRPDVSYYWSVQTIDHRLVGSPFAPERVSMAASPSPAEPSAPIVTENYPNPFNPTTTIHFELSTTAHVKVVVYNVLGAEVATLMNDQLAAGAHDAVWSGRDAAGRPVPSGLYLYAVETPDARITRTMHLIK